MLFRSLCASGAVLSLLCVTSAFAEFSEPQPIGAGEVLIQYDAGKPTETQVQVCAKLGGEVVRLDNGKYVCVRRST